MSRQTKRNWAITWTVFQVRKYDGGHRKSWTWEQLKQLTRPVEGKKRNE